MGLLDQYDYPFIVNEHLMVVWDIEKLEMCVLVNQEPFNPKLWEEPQDVEPYNKCAEFASLLRTWAENGYVDSFLDSWFAYPLLKALAKAGDELARHIINEDLETRFQAGNPTIRYSIFKTFGELLDPSLVEEYLDDQLKEMLLDRYSHYSLADAYHYRGSELEWEGDHESAVKAYRKAVAVQPDHVDSWRMIALNLDEVGDIDGASTAYRAWISLAPDDRDASCLLTLLCAPACTSYLGVAWYRRGIRLEHDGNWAAAVKAFGTANILRPHNILAYRRIARLYEKMEDRESAIEVYRALLSFSPSDREATDYLTRLGELLH